MSGATGFILVANILDDDDNSITHWKGSSGQMTLHNPQLWWPYTMNKNNSYAYLYTLKASRDIKCDDHVLFMENQTYQYAGLLRYETTLGNNTSVNVIGFFGLCDLEGF